MMLQRNVSKRFACLPLIAVFAFGVASLYGCVSLSLSRAFVDPGTGWLSEAAGRGQRIIGHEVDIFVKTSNSFSKLEDGTKSDTFGVSLYFIPKIENLEFIPSGVSLMFPGVPAIKPARINLKNAGYNASIWECGPYPIANFGPGPHYVLRRGFCVDLYFNVRPPSPDTEFMLRIPELIQNSRRISIPDLKFKKGTLFYSIGNLSVSS